MRLVLLLALLFIVYGTLYPFNFDADLAVESPLWVLLHSWPERFDRWVARDIVTNVLLYAPLGFAATLSFGRRWWAAMLLATSLSAGVEMLQVYEVARTCSLLDVLCNSVGAGIGALTALAVPQRGSRWHLNRAKARPAFVAACWFGYQLYPFVPMVSRTHLRTAWARFEAVPLTAVEIGINTAEWFAVALLVEAVLGRVRAWWLALALLVVPARLLLADRTLAPAELWGGALAVLLWAAIPGARRGGAGAWFVGAAILAAELQPFRFASEPGPFSWIPFAATLEADWVPAAAVLLRKAFDYGAMVWLARGFGVARTGAILAAALVVLEQAQRFLPRRQAEITDAVLALAMTAVLVWPRWR